MNHRHPLPAIALGLLGSLALGLLVGWAFLRALDHELDRQSPPTSWHHGDGDRVVVTPRALRH